MLMVVGMVVSALSGNRIQNRLFCGFPQSLAGGTRVPVLRDGIHAVAPHGQMLPRFGSTTQSSS
jgi:hypothetical protein